MFQDIITISDYAVFDYIAIGTASGYGISAFMQNLKALCEGILIGAGIGIIVIVIFLFLLIVGAV